MLGSTSDKSNKLFLPALQFTQIDGLVKMLDPLIVKHKLVEFINNCTDSSLSSQSFIKGHMMISIEEYLRKQLHSNRYKSLLNLIFKSSKMDSSEFEEKAIQLVSVTPEGKYQMHPLAEMFIRKIPKPIAVVSVAGLYRTGKSFLLNRILLNRNNGFGVGPTINPCTKGLWCWGVPLKGMSSDGEKVNILIIDSEGIGALDQDQNHDIKIFTLAILSSSTFIYNSVGSIDQNALQNLSMVVNLTKNIQLNTESQEQQDPDQLARYFPTFFWVVRDFALQLVSAEGDQLTPKDYLERALAPQKGFSDDVQEKNRIRRLLTAFFKNRQCATLVRPLVNEQKLQRLEQCTYDQLRPQFVEQALTLRKKILTNTKPKMLKGEHLDGTMYISMLNSYLNAINNGGVPNIQNAWTYMCIEKSIKLQEKCYDFFTQETEKVFADNLPCSQAGFQNEMDNIQNQCFKIFQNEGIGEESKSYFQELKNNIKDKISLMRIQNERESINFLKNYIIKNFSVIEKKMKMNQFQNFQQYLKAINNFYLYLIENGPDLPKKQIVYLDFLKKVTTQGAEIFIKQINMNLESVKYLSIEKEKIYKIENQQLKNKIKSDSQKFKSKFESLLSQKTDIQKRYNQINEKYEHLKVSSTSQMMKMQNTYENKLKMMQMKSGQIWTNLEDLKQKKETLQTSYIFEKKQREKERALLQLKVNQYKDELKSLKIKQKNQQVYINDMNIETTNKMKQITFEYEKKIFNLSQELTRFKQLYDEINETKDELQNKLKNLEINSALNTKKYQQELRIQVEKLQNYKLFVEADKVEQTKKLHTGNEELQRSLAESLAITLQYERKIKQLSDKIKSVSSQSEKQIAIMTQKIQFLNQEALDTKEKYNRTIQHYEGMLKNQTEMKEQQLRAIFKAQIELMEDQHLAKVTKLQTELVSLREKYQQETSSIKKSEENLKFTYDLQIKKLQSEIKNQVAIAQNLEKQRNKILIEKQTLVREMQEKLQMKENYYEQRITMLENQLQLAMDSASRQQTQISYKSQESLKQLKNYYELDRQRLEQRLVNEKQKYEKRINQMRDEYEKQLEEQKTTAEQQFETLKEQYNNEVSMLKDLIVNLQHENQSKARSLQSSENRHEQLKAKLDKKEVEFNNKIQALHKTSSHEKQLLQQKIIESNELRSTLEKEVLVINHQKEQLAKQIKGLTTKYEEKIQEIFYLNKSMERNNNETRQKLNELNNQYMNQRLNYEKKIALGEQQKQFYSKKIEQFQKQQAKNSTALDDLTKKLISEHQEQIKALENKKNIDYTSLQNKYQKLKRISKQNEQQINRNINQLQKQLALQKQKFSNLQQKYEDLQQKRSTDGTYLSTELYNVKQQLAKVNKQYSEQIQKLKRELNDAINDKNQIQVLYEKDIILLQNKVNYLQETKQKERQQHAQKIRKMEQTIENNQVNRIKDKNYYQSAHSENIAKIQKKYNTIIQQAIENLAKKQRENDIKVQELQKQIRSLKQKMGKQIQELTETNKSQERALRQLQQSQKRAISQLQKVKSHKQISSSESQSLYERERQALKQKLQQRQEKYKNLEKIKQQNYYNFEKQKAKWNLQKQNYFMKNDELKEVISKQEKDLEKLSRQNEKLKAQKKCNKLSGLSSFSRYSMQRGNSKYSLEDSINSINLSTSKQNCNPLGQLSFFNNQ